MTPTRHTLSLQLTWA